MGKLINIHELPSKEWREKYCNGFKPEDVKYTHGAIYVCDKCDKSPYISKLTTDNINGYDPILCPLCKKIS